MVFVDSEIKNAATNTGALSPTQCLTRAIRDAQRTPYPRLTHGGPSIKGNDDSSNATRCGDQERRLQEHCQRAIKVYDMILLVKVHLTILTTVKALLANRG